MCWCCMHIGSASGTDVAASIPLTYLSVFLWDYPLIPVDHVIYWAGTPALYVRRGLAPCGTTRGVGQYICRTSSCCSSK